MTRCFESSRDWSVTIHGGNPSFASTRTGKQVSKWPLSDMEREKNIPLERLHYTREETRNKDIGKAGRTALVSAEPRQRIRQFALRKQKQS